MAKKKMMDSRCPMGLNEFPCQTCPLAVERLRALERVSGNASHMQESKMPGCDWAINDRDSNYCFFKYILFNSDRDHSTIEIAEKLKITQAAVYSALHRALMQVKDSDIIELLKSEFNTKSEE